MTVTTGTAVPLKQGLLAARQRHRPRTLALGLLVVVIAVVLPITAGNTWDLEFALAGIYAVVGLSMSLLVGRAGQVSLGQQALVALGAFSAANLVTLHSVPLPVGILAGVAAGGVAAALLGIVSLRLHGLNLALTTLIFGIAAQDSIFQMTQFAGGGTGMPLYRPDILASNLRYYWLVLAFLILVAWLDWRIVGSKAGRGISALGADARIAQSFGVNRVGYGVLAFVISGMVAGLAGALWAGWEQLVVSSDWSYQLGLTFLIMVVIAGGRRRSSVIIASVFFGIFGYVLTKISPLVNAVGTTNLAYFVPAVGGILLVVMLVVNARHDEVSAVISGPGPRRNGAGGQGGLLRLADSKLDETAVAADSAETAEPARETRGEGPSTDGRRPTEHVLRVEELSVSFGGLDVLSEVSLEVRRGEIVGMVGPNGAGKTTCFNCISGFLRPTGGAITFCGENINRLLPDRRAQLGMARTFQHVGLVQTTTVLGNLLLAGHTRVGYHLLQGIVGTPKSFRTELELRRAAEWLLEDMSLTDIAYRRIADLPYGLRKSAEIAAVTFSRPSLMLLDEPTSGMSLDEGRELIEQLRIARERTGAAILLVEHHIPLVAELCDFVYVLDAGRMLSEGDPKTVQQDRDVIAAYLGSSFVE